MNYNKHRICPVEMAGHLDNRIRKWIQDPQKILRPYVKEGMTVLDLGCGPGFFTIELVKLVGRSGRVIAVDLQQGMLEKIRAKVRGTEIEKQILLHRCEENKIGVSESIDFALAFYMVHEVIYQDRFFAEIRSILKPDGRFFIVEPPFHVSKKKFEQTLRLAHSNGLIEVERPKVFLSKAVMLKRE